MARFEPTFTEQELQTEEWRPVPGYEDLYSASNIGRIRRDKPYLRHRHLPFVILRPALSRRGYLRVVLSRKCHGVNCSVHRLVLAAFHNEPSSKQVNHRDGNKTNNRLENLEYVTSSENHRHAIQLGLKPKGETHYRWRNERYKMHGEHNWNSRFTDARRREIHRRRNNGERLAPLAKEFLVTETTISRIARNPRWAV